MYTYFYTPKTLGSRVSQYFQTIAEFYFKFEDDSKNGGKNHYKCLQFQSLLHGSTR